MYRSRGRRSSVGLSAAFVVLILAGCSAPINLTIVPNVVNQTLSAGKESIEDSGLVVGAVTEAFNNTVPAGNIISQDPSGDITVSPGSAVSLVISKGPQPVTVTVPDVTGQPRAAAETAITGAQLVAGTVIEAFSDTVPAGNVIGQDPVAGATVSPGTAVGLAISKGPQPVTVPDVTGQPRAAAETAITGAQLVAGTVTEAFSDTVPAGNVIRQDPVAGATLAPGTIVNLVVSKGPQPVTVTVPDVTGQPRSAAETAVTGAQLVVGTVTEAFSDTILADHVISQDPVAGVTVAPGSAVNLVVSKGPQPVTVTVPDVTGQPRSAAETAITGAQLLVGAVTEAFSDTVPVGNVISQVPLGGASAAAGTSVDLVISRGQEIATYEPGAVVEKVVTPVGERGGVLEGPASTQLAGVSVSIPGGALPKDVRVSLGYDSGHLHPLEGTASGVVIVLRTPGVTMFQQPVEITFPYGVTKDASAFPVPYCVDEEGNLHLVTLTHLDREHGTATVQTFHPLVLTWVLDSPDAKRLRRNYATKFVSSADGFQIANNGSTVNRQGECFGMTSFALWYFEKHLASGHFFPRYMSPVSDSGLLGQNIIATRSFISISQQWSVYLPIIDEQSFLRNRDQLAVIENALVNTHNPVLIHLEDTEPQSDRAHSVLAYAYYFDDSTGRTNVAVYNPNTPDDNAQAMSFNGTTFLWDTYDGYELIVYTGDGSLNLTEPYQYIFDDAEAGFHTSADAVITIDYYHSGDLVPARMTNLAGSVENGQVAVTQVTVFVDSVPFTTSVGFDGRFWVPIPIQVGVNHLTFETKGNNADSILIPVNNNMASEDFQLIGAADPAAIQVTLTWDKNDTDLDLYVIDPTGDYACYFHEFTMDGSDLDQDITGGYGPEHWTLPYKSTVRWNEDYRVRVHYYSDHGNGPVNYTVTILMYEGTDRQRTFSYRGNVPESNLDNRYPGNSGPDWIDVATIRPVQSDDKR